VTTPIVTTPVSPTPNPGQPSSCQPLPATVTTKANSRLPDPFTFYDGRKVTTKAEWACRQQEISELVQRFELGTYPPKPSSVTGSLSGNSISVQVQHDGKSISFSASVSFPSSGTAPFPAIIAVGGSSVPTPAGVAVINFNNGDIAEQANSGSRGRGKFYTLYGSGHSAAATTAWAWGVARIIDVLETVPNSRIDLTKLGVTGCSRNGKGAIIVGAFEKRIALTIPQESGSGGAACWRISDAMKAKGANVQTASQIITENVWLSPNFNQWVNKVNELPVDHHYLAAMIAPRGLIVIENSGQEWLGAESTFGCMKAGTKVYEALGVPGNMGVTQIGGHSHCVFPSGQQSDYNAFIDKFFRGNANANTNIVRTDKPTFVDATWIDWQIPNLT